MSRTTPAAHASAGCARLIGSRCCWSSPARCRSSLSNYHMFQLTLVLVYAIALLGLNILTGYNGQISLGHGAFYAIGAYIAAILMDKFGVPYWADDPGRRRRLPRRRLPVRPAGAAAGGPLPRARHLRAGVAMPQILKYNLEHWTGGVQGIVIVKPDAPVRPAAQSRTSGSTSSRWLVVVVLFVARLEPAARPHRPRAWWRSATTRSPPRRWASTPRCYKSLDLRRQRAVHRRRRRARRDRGAVRRARQLQHLPVDHASWSASWSAAWPRSPARSSARCSSSSCRTSPTRSPRPRRGRSTASS